MENDAIRSGTGPSDEGPPRQPVEGEVAFPAAGAQVEGALNIPAEAVGLVVFAHGSGSSRFSPRNRSVADDLQAAGLGTFLIDLLTPDEARADDRTGRHRFDIELLAGRLVGAVDWVGSMSEIRNLPIGLFGASTGAAAALVAAAEREEAVRAVVSRGGRPDLAGEALPRVRAPTLLIVGGEDREVLRMNEEAAAKMSAEVSLEVVPGATHLFEERGALHRVAELARDWFVRHLPARHLSLGRHRAVPAVLPGEPGAPDLPESGTEPGAIPPAPSMPTG